ncbi:MAG: UvrD-helicase domain-containing protein [Ruminococcus sp.]|nr:UvrD-helicase domain-containing protein [Ruminococcus sp.]
MKWNEKQQQAIDTRDRGVVVSAAAGSGKTAVLVERTISMLTDCENKLPADGLLAVTFTNEAADQMRRKLTLAFEKKLKESRDPEEKKWIAAQRDALALARISTINSFCYDLVKRCLNEFDFEDGVRIIEENDAEAILSKAFDEALDSFAAAPGGGFDLLYKYFGGKTSAVRDSARALYRFLRSLPFPEEWTEKTVARLRSGSTDIYLDTLGYTFTGMLDKAEKLNEQAVHLLGRFTEKTAEITCSESIFQHDLAVIRRLRDCLGAGDWRGMFEAFPDSYPNIKTKPKDPADYPPELAALFGVIHDLREQEKKVIGKIRDALSPIGRDIEGPLIVSADILEQLAAYVRLAEDIAYKEKLRRNVLEFSDVEIMALSLLVKKENGKLVRTPFASELVSNREYSILLIDEFQDVNNLQELIFKALSDTDDLDVFGKNVFVVGDVKQSIYGFRLSNPGLFIRAKEQAAEDANKDRLSLVELALNYRSRGCVIDFVNLVFSNIMSEEAGELEYTGGERLVRGAGYKDDDCPTEVIFVDDAAADSGDDSGGDDGLSIDENYAIAKRIREMIDAGTPVYDDADKPSRPCVPGDFCILYRSSGAVETLKAALSAYGLKAAAEKSAGYLRSREVSLVMSLLKVIDNPMRDIPMAAVMLSPIMGFTADELARIRLLGRKVTEKTYDNGRKRKVTYYAHLYQIISAVGQTDEAAHHKESEKLVIDDPVLEKKCRDARELVRKLSFYSAGMSLSKLIRRIYDETELLAAVSSLENSRQKRANLRLLLRYADSYCENSDGSASGFIRYLEMISESGKDFTQAATEVEDENSVLVKTIHASKGLEFPFVFLCGLTRTFNERDLRSNMLLDEKCGAGFTLCDKDTLVRTETAAHAAVKLIKRGKLISEEMRLLYVALTRARERLFLPLCMRRSADGSSKTEKMIKDLAADISRSGGITPRLVRECSSYAGWLCAVLLCSEYSGELCKRFGISYEMPAASGKAGIVFSDYSAGDERKKESPDYRSGAPDSSLVTQLLTRFIGHQSAEPDPAAAKLSVTEIVAEEKARQDPDRAVNPFFPNVPTLDEELGRLTAAQRGTCTHLFMELADYTLAEQDVKAELDRLTSQGFFTEKERRGVYVDALRRFFEGDLYKRMKASPLRLREKKFLVAFEELDLPDSYRSYLTDGSMLQGVADCLFLEEDGYVLVDYKTDNFRDVSELYGYKTQLELYKAALDLILDKPVKACYIYSFKLAVGAEIAL